MRFVQPPSDVELRTLTDAYTYGHQPGFRRRVYAIVLSHKHYKTLDRYWQVDEKRFQDREYSVRPITSPFLDTVS